MDENGGTTPLQFHSGEGLTLTGGIYTAAAAANDPVVEVRILPTLEFDGRAFNVSVEALPYLYLAARARRGDALAAELLAGTTVRGADGKQYWPAPELAAHERLTDDARMLARAVLAGEVDAARALADEIVGQCGG